MVVPRCASWLVWLLLLPTAVARADPPSSSPPSLPNVDPEAEARALYEVGDRHFELGEYDQAIEYFRRAYERSARPGLMFNMAQAYRLTHDCAHALPLYRDYLRLEPEASNRAKIEEYIAAMAQCPAPPPPPSPSPAATSIQPGYSGHSERAKRIAGFGMLLGGLGLSAPAIFFSVQAQRSSSEISRLFHSGGPWDAHAESVDQQGRNAVIGEAVLYSLASAAVLGGTLLCILGRPQARSQRLTFSPRTDGGLLTFRGEF